MSTVNDALAKELARRAQARLADINRRMRETTSCMTQQEWHEMLIALAPYFTDANRCLRIIIEGATENDAKWLVWKTEASRD